MRALKKRGITVPLFHFSEWTRPARRRDAVGSNGTRHRFISSTRVLSRPLVEPTPKRTRPAS